MESNTPLQTYTPPKPPVVIFEVHFTIDKEVVKQFDERLYKHSEEVSLTLPGIITAIISVPDIEDENKVHRCIQYHLNSQPTLDNCIQSKVRELLTDCLKKFESHFATEQRLLSVAEINSATDRICANCDSALIGRFCNVCGQREEPRVPTLWTLTSEYSNALFCLESKLWNSCRMLLFKPGQLTVEYLSGKRQKYMSPLRLYLLFSIITFAYFAFLNSQNGLGIHIDTAPDIETVKDKLNDDTTTSDSKLIDIGRKYGLISGDARANIKRDIDEGNQQAVFNKFFDQLPKALFLLLPIVALLFKILYLGSGKYYVEHLIYQLHNHAFLFLVTITSSLISQITEHWPRLDLFIWAGSLLALSVYVYPCLRKFLISKFSKSRFRALLYLLLIVGLLVLLFRSLLAEGMTFIIILLWLFYVPFYLYRSMRLVYQRSRWITAVSFSVISMMYFILFVTIVGTSIVIVGYSYN